jgi:predicted component of type VI protein secretion system
MRGLQREIEKAIGWFEPRLRDPRVTVEPKPGSTNDLVAKIEATLRLEHVYEPVAFRIALQPAQPSRS